jgi:hypothetical protein
VSVCVNDVSIESFVSNVKFVGIGSEIESVGVGCMEGNSNGMCHMWLGWRWLIRNNRYIFQGIAIYSVDCV